jgi:hypothetical protein
LPPDWPAAGFFIPEPFSRGPVFPLPRPLELVAGSGFGSMKCCWMICTALVVVQYTTSPAGKVNPMKPKNTGMIRASICCCWFWLGEARCICFCW